ncbi:MAG TPA: ABC transporter ATP-binding protein [Solirubrobacteraceae bacterium]|jgi:peptide/nickel transport system ATP-binding protein|nr:ABC transporter ATP-binding protein [Solirubrobacteraceae bacterium]
MAEPILRVSDLRVELTSGQPVVSGVSFTLAAGETLGLVGESGSGKSTIALALLGYARRGMRIAAGEVEIGGERIALQDERAARAIRGRLVSHVPQDPNTNLNPSLRIGRAINDVLVEHRAAEADEAHVYAALERVDLPGNRAFARRFPHQLSGGQKQRVLIAAALVCEPPLVVLDEPTTGLDVVTQARILEEVKRLHRERQIAMIYVSHDIAVVSQVADHVAVLYGGLIVEQGSTARVLATPRHPYTRGLIGAVPDHTQPRKMHGIPGVAVGVDDRPNACPFVPRCELRVERCTHEMPKLEPFDGRDVRCFEAARTPGVALGDLRERGGGNAREDLLVVEHLRAVHRDGRNTVIAADDVSLRVAQGSCVALVGESGSGKTTIARVIAGLHRPSAGRLTLGGVELAARAQDRPRELRRRCQIVFQDPYESLNPRRRIVNEIARPARLLRGLSRSEARGEVGRLLEQVRLPAAIAEAYPSELSGGERQRVAIARALASEPDLLVCDEITSALDVSVQAAVIELLADLRSRLSLSLLFITHNLGVVAAIADHVLILDRGLICEEGPVDEVFSNPRSERAVELLAAAPTLRAAA